jgi:2-polyprenyl-3-methyl-5-hydroxy-6-metoxy-1,4-benzoquinol methylase
MADEAYIEWKDWRDEAFGRFDALQARYYAAETGVSAIAGARVLEIGFGNGSFIGWARSVNADVFGVELSSELAARACALLGEHRAFTSLSDDRLASLSGTFSLVVAFDVIEHIAQDELPGFLAKLRALLAADGRVILRFPNGDSPFGRIYQHGDPTHLTTIGQEKLRYFARQSGLEVQVIRAPTLSLSGARFSRALKRTLIETGRHLVERAVALLYFGGRKVPLTPNYVAVLARVDTAI